MTSTANSDPADPLPAQPGADLLQSALLRLQRQTGADLVLLGDVLAEPVPRVRSLCCRRDGQWLASFSYLLHTHPCGEVHAAQAWQHIADAPARFRPPICSWTTACAAMPATRYGWVKTARRGCSC